uniref:Open rectifier potassium channel protein 1 n=2 Tax=Lygus hesperus TaxID=30085 RepID=A0A0A9Z728_LYGHE
MSKKEWIFLWFLFIAYLFLGATIFFFIERDLEEQRRRQDVERQILLRVQLEKHYQPVRSERSIGALAKHITQYCTKEFSRALEESNLTLKEGTEAPYLWTYYNAFFFTLTTLSTIGYGNLYPSSNEGKMILIVYALIGIPFTTIILARLGDFFGSRLLRAHHRYKNHVYDSRLTLVLDVLIYLIPGIVIFILAPTIFMKFEDWTFYQALYYAFITLTTIGFGDLVAGQSAGTDTVGETLYKIFILVWIMFGLGYLIMIFGFITRALKSKKLAKIEQKLASRFKTTQSKIWHEFLEDVSIMRRALNEAYINKVKPVYREKQPLWTTSGLSRSMPNLDSWPEPLTREELEEWKDSQASGVRPPMRRRAMSEGVEGLEVGLPRVLSEGALVDIDIETTFKDRPRPSLAHQDLQTDEFLNRMAQRRLSVFDPSLHDGGFNLFSDDEILESEEYATKDSFDSLRYRPKRSRARSDAFFDTSQRAPSYYDHQITWAGSDSLRAQAMMKNMRMKADVESGDKLEKPSPAANIRRLSVAAINFFSGDKKKKDDKKRKNGSFSDQNQNHRGSFVEDEDDTLPFSEEFLTLTGAGGRRQSLLDVLGPMPSSGSSTPMSPMLEQTTLADFIRVMSTLRGLEGMEGQEGAAGTVAPGSISNRESRRASLVQIFSGPDPPLPRELLRARDTATSTGNLPRARRYSQAPVPANAQGFRRRAASISQGQDDITLQTPPNLAVQPIQSLAVQSKHKPLSEHSKPTQIKRASLPTVIEDDAADR